MAPSADSVLSRDQSVSVADGQHGPKTRSPLPTKITSQLGCRLRRKLTVGVESACHQHLPDLAVARPGWTPHGRWTPAAAELAHTLLAGASERVIESCRRAARRAPPTITAIGGAAGSR